MLLNKGTCELLTANPNANMHFEDNTRITTQMKATYLGCEIGINTGSREKITNDSQTQW